jgi:hypothetical protein
VSLATSSTTKEELLIMVGQLVLISQTTEKAIKLCMTSVLQKYPPLTFEKLQVQQKKERRSSLGYFLNELKKRASVEENFESLLDEYLDQLF